MSAIAPATWFRHRWPWILMSGPALVVAAGLFTAVLAVRSEDSLVADDYYKQGLAINGVLDRTRHAAELQIRARFAFDGTSVRVTLSDASPASVGLRLTLLHPALAAHDQVVALTCVSHSVYEGRLREVPQGVRHVILEDREGAWRLDGAMRDLPSALVMGGARP